MVTAYDVPQLVPSYTDPHTEARICRGACALFDFSFVHRVRLEGPDAASATQAFTSRSLGGMSSGQVRYGLKHRSDGTLLSDLTIWKHSETCFDIMTGHAPDVAEIVDKHPGLARDLTPASAVLAVQGPASLEALCDLGTSRERLGELNYFRLTPLYHPDFAKLEEITLQQPDTSSDLAIDKWNEIGPFELEEYVN